MAKTFNFQHLPRVVIENAYAMIGETHIYHFDERAEIVVYIFESEAARKQELSESEHELHRPLRKITVATTIDTFNEFLRDPSKALAAAGYELITNVPESASANPRGLKTLLDEAADI